MIMNKPLVPAVKRSLSYGLLLTLLLFSCLTSAKEDLPSCSASLTEKDPNLHWMTYDIGEGPMQVQVYIDPPMETYYQGNPPSSTAVTPSFNGFQAKFISMSAKPVSFYWVSNSGQKVEMRHYEPFQASGTSSFPGHKFLFSEFKNPSQVLKQFTVRPYPANLYVYDPYTVEGDPVQTERNLQSLTDSERDKWNRWKKTLSFHEQYLNFTGRSYLANYLREPPMHFMWRADYFDQIHWITTPETHFVQTPPEALLSPITQYGKQYRKLHESKNEKVLLAEYREQHSLLNMTLKVLSCQPRVFEIQNFLSPAEVQHILDLAQKENLALSTTGDGRPVKDTTKTRTSYNSWVERERSPIIDVIYRRSADLLRIDEALLRFRPDGERPDVYDSSPFAERLQLVHYDYKQEYTAQ